MLNYQELKEMYEKGELERMSWEEFLSSCDASHYWWNYYPEGVVEDKGDYIVVEVDLGEDPDINWGDSSELEFLGENEILVDWGEPVIIVDPPEDKIAYIILYKRYWKNSRDVEKYIPQNGILYPTPEEALKELEEILQEEEG